MNCFQKNFLKMFTLCFLTILSSIKAEDTKQTICLNMIVKDEEKVIARALESAKPLIDYWIIVDTGSSDKTMEIIKDTMKGIPGELYQRPWKNFGHNRNEALQLAKNKGDYILFLDADETLVYEKDYKFPKMDMDAYLCTLMDFDNRSIKRALVINNKKNWHWKHVFHEELVCEDFSSSGFIQDVKINATYTDGCRNQDPQKHFKDVATLEKAVKDEPNNSRYTYYLAQGYFNTKQYKKALESYEKRATMGGWDQEVFWAIYCSGMLKERLKYPTKDIINTYVKAFHFRPIRSEPLYRLATVFAQEKNYVLSYLLCEFALSIPKPAEIGHIEDFIYDYALFWEYANSAFNLKKFAQAKKLYQVLLESNLPNDIKKVIKKNLIVTEQNLFLMK